MLFQIRFHPQKNDTSVFLVRVFWPLELRFWVCTCLWGLPGGLNALRVHVNASELRLWPLGGAEGSSQEGALHLPLQIPHWSQAPPQRSASPLLFRTHLLDGLLPGLRRAFSSSSQLGSVQIMQSFDDILQLGNVKIVRPSVSWPSAFHQGYLR